MKIPIRKQISAGRRILYFLLALFSLASLPLLSQAQDGTEMYDAIPIGSFSSCGGTPYYDSRNNAYYNGISYSDNFSQYSAPSNYYSSQPSPDVWYSFTVSDNADLTFSLCGSNYDTYIHVMDDYGNIIDHNDDSSCGTPSYLSISGLSAGTYYVIVEGYGYSTGNYELNINSQSSGTPPPGANMVTAINGGTFSSSGTFINSLSNADPCLGNNYGRPSIDIYYKFVLDAPATVKLSHCGSGFDTYMWLLNSIGVEITHNDDNGLGSPCPGLESYIETTLSAGTYYVVSEGYGSSPGVISTSIQVAIAGGNSCLNLSQDHNYVVSYSPREEMLTTGQVLTNSCDPYKVNATVQYFDGLGRPLQTVQVKGNNDASKDLIIPIEYDQFGREAKKYLPYTNATSDGSYKTDALTAQPNFYNPYPGGNSGDQMANGIVRNPYPFSQTVFEPSPLNRVIEQGSPGVDWQPVANSTTGHTMKMGYSSNAANEVKLWTVTSNGATVTTNYNANELYKTISKDENWTSGTQGTTEEFKDKEGRVVLKKVWEDNTYALSTYYVYDDFGNLRYVIPPALNDSHTNGQNITSFTEGPTDANFNNYIYAYRYDGRRRLIEKKIPGKGWECIVYNKIDQVVLTQDARQKLEGKWLFTKYDGLGRVIVTGLYNDGASRMSLQTTVDAEINNQPLWEQKDGAGIGYTNNSFPRAIAYYHGINHYDDYNFPDNTFGGITGNQSNMTRGLPTATKTTTLGTGSMLLTVMYYDKFGRAVQSKSQNHLSGTDQVDNTYSFVGETETSTRTHIVGTSSTTIASRYKYDHVGRKKESYQKTFSSPAVTATEVQLSSLTYNEIDQLKAKAVGNNLNTTSYSYNERGWLADLSNNTVGFSESLRYNTPETGTIAQYNGNIANQLYTNGASNIFSYTYDRLNRLTGSTATGLGEQISYDVMGNITQMVREGYGTNYYTGYNGNQLNTISGFTNGSYAYDVNGNVETGPSGLSLSYNYLNLPITATKTSTGLSSSYVYDATGQKLKKLSNLDGTSDYVSGIHYENNSIAFIQTEEGRALPAGGGNYNYQYNLSDHLGNVRTSFWRNPNSQILEVTQRDNYYAFGLRKAVTPGVSPENNYLYNGKELQKGLDQLDYGARFYDPMIGRFNTIDPLAEIDRRWSSYSYGHNNPISHIDVDGMFDWVMGADNKPYWDDNVTRADDPDLKSGDTYIGKTATYTSTGGYSVQLNDKTNLAPGQDSWNYVLPGNGDMMSSNRTTGVTLQEAIRGNLTGLKVAEVIAETAVMMAIPGGGVGAGGGGLMSKLIYGGAEYGGLATAESLSVGYNSFRAFKAANGAAGEGLAWHHIVEQSVTNVERFGGQTIHNAENLTRLPHGAGTIHARISGYYSSIQPFTNGLRVRKWLSTQSFQEQYNFGIQTLQKFSK